MGSPVPLCTKGPTTPQKSCITGVHRLWEADLGVGGGDQAGPLLWGLGPVQLGGDTAGQQLLDGLAPGRGAQLHVAVLGQQLHQLFLLHSPGTHAGAGVGCACASPLSPWKPGPC